MKRADPHRHSRLPRWLRGAGPALLCATITFGCSLEPLRSEADSGFSPAPRSDTAGPLTFPDAGPSAADADLQSDTVGPLSLPDAGASAADADLHGDTLVPPHCGDDTVEQGVEQCDGSDLDERDCASFGFFDGTLSCRANCTFDLSGCHNCGDGICDANEDADSCGTDCCTPCGTTCCSDNELCYEKTYCAAPTAGTTLVYATLERHDGNLGGRAGADSICQGDKPDGILCGTAHALLSVSPTDEIADMPGKWFFADKPLFFHNRTTATLTRFADDWAHALDAYRSDVPDLDATAEDSTGVSFDSAWHGFWTGSQVNGQYQPLQDCGDYTCKYNYTCAGWTRNQPTGGGNTYYDSTLGISVTYYGTQGAANSKTDWLHSMTYNYVGCNYKMPLLCACKL